MIPVVHILVVQKTQIVDILAFFWEILSSVLRSFLLIFFAEVLGREKQYFYLTRSPLKLAGMQLGNLTKLPTQYAELLSLTQTHSESGEVILLTSKFHLQV